LNKKLGLAIILVEQDIRFIRKLANRVKIIQKGVFIAELEPSQLYQREVVDEHLGI
jgi:ABC-type branched-subunit amino acid transport system ATPase component